jgi:hypothetical protein
VDQGLSQIKILTLKGSALKFSIPDACLPGDFCIEASALAVAKKRGMAHVRHPSSIP